MDIIHITNPYPSLNGRDDSDMDVSDTSSDHIQPTHPSPRQDRSDDDTDAEAEPDADGEFINVGSDDSQEDENDQHQTHGHPYTSSAIAEAHANPDLYGLRRSVRLFQPLLLNPTLIFFLGHGGLEQE